MRIALGDLNHRLFQPRGYYELALASGFNTGTVVSGQRWDHTCANNYSVIGGTT
jgi:hypothetical protein